MVEQAEFDADDGDRLGEMSSGCTGTGASTLSSWVGSADPCYDGTTGPSPAGFDFLQCENYNVVGIDLSGLDMTGCVFPATWIPGPGLTFVKTLRVNNSTGLALTADALLPSIETLEFVGSTPPAGGLLPSMVNMTSLKVLKIIDYPFTGPIPSGFGSLAQLTEVRFSGTGLTGPIPSDFASLTSLAILDLSYSSGMCGSVPSGLAACTLFDTTGTSIDQPCGGGASDGSLAAHTAACGGGGASSPLPPSPTPSPAPPSPTPSPPPPSPTPSPPPPSPEPPSPTPSPPPPSPEPPSPTPSPPPPSPEPPSPTPSPPPPSPEPPSPSPTPSPPPPSPEPPSPTPSPPPPSPEPPSPTPSPSPPPPSPEPPSPTPSPPPPSPEPPSPSPSPLPPSPTPSPPPPSPSPSPLPPSPTPSPPPPSPPSPSPPPALPWERQLDTLPERPLQRAGRPLTVLLRTHRAFNLSSNQAWSAALLPPGAAAGASAAPAGALAPWRYYNGEYQWRAVVPASQLQKAGNYTLFVFATIAGTPASLNVSRNGSRVAIWPGPPAAAGAALALTPLAPGNTTAVGDPLGVDLRLVDAFGNPAQAAAGVSVTLAGPASRRTVVPGANFTALGAGAGAGGAFRYVHVLEAQELLTAALNVTGVTAASASLAVAAVAPEAVAYGASVGAATVKLYGSSAGVAGAGGGVSLAPGLALTGLSEVSNRLNLPVVRPLGVAFGGNPGLRAVVTLAGPRPGTGGAVASAATSFNGSWSFGNRSYVAFFKAPAPGVYDVTVSLSHPAMSSASASVALVFNATQPPLAVAGSLTLSALNASRVGDWAYLTAALRDVAGQPAMSTAGVTLTARGSASGSLDLALAPAGGGAWRARYDFTQQESVAFTLTVAGAVAGTATVSVLGVAPSYLSLPASLAAARMINVLSASAAPASNTTTTTTSSSSTSSSNSSTSSTSSSSSSSGGLLGTDVTTGLASAAIAAGAALVVPLAQAVSVEVPVLTAQGGRRWLSDPALSVALSLVPSALLEDVSSTYAAALQGSLRRLLRAAGELDPAATAAGGGGAYGDRRRGLQAGTTGTSTGNGTAGFGGSTYYDVAAWNSSAAAYYGSAYSHAYDYPAYTGEFAADNAAGAGVDLGAYAWDPAAEPRDPWPAPVAGGAAPAPPLNADSPEAVSAIQDRLAATPGVLTFKGNFSTFKSAYLLSLWLPAADTYTALLSVRAPAVAGSLRLSRFLLTGLDVSALASAANANSQWDPAVNPLVTLNVEYPGLASPAAYPGGATGLLADVRRLLAARAGLAAPDNVVVWSLGAGAAGTGVKLVMQIWFDAKWASISSGFSAMSALQFFYLRLTSLPGPLLSDPAAYPALPAAGIAASNVSLSEPFASQLLGSSTATAADGTTTTGTPLTILPISLSDATSGGGSTTLTTSAVLAAAAASGDPALAAPPVLTLVGEPYVEVVEGGNFTDPGAYMYDPLDGFGAAAGVRVTVRLCSRRPDLATLMYALDAAAAAASAAAGASGNATTAAAVSAAAVAAASAPPPAVFTCLTSPALSAAANSSSSAGNATAASGSLTVFASGFALDASTANAASQMYLLSYSAVNSRGAAAVPRHRALVVRPRCDAAAGEFWCPALGACSVGRVCSPSLATLAFALAAVSSATSTSSSSSTTSAALDAAAVAAAAGTAASGGAAPLAVLSTPDGGVAVVGADGSTVFLDPLAYTRTSFASADALAAFATDPNNYGLLGNLLLSATDLGGGASAAAATAAAAATSGLLSAEQPVYSRDTLPPTISLLGSGVPALTADGSAVMVDTVEVGSAWADPGAVARDARDGDLTALLQTYGAAAVDTSRPTPPGAGFSFLVEYAVSDLSGNAAEPARRLVVVACPANRTACTDVSGLPACATPDGICGGDAIAPAGAITDAAANVTDATTNATSTTTSTSTTSTSTAVTAATLLTSASLTPPSLRLIGPAEVAVTQGSSFERCAASLLPATATCDAGAAAWDVRDGSLDLRVTVCGAPLRASRPGQVLLPLALACNASTATPGTYTLTYAVANSAGVAAYASRRLTVLPACPPGERVCSGGGAAGTPVVCSTGGGTCADNLLESTSALAANFSLSLASGAAAAPPAAPTLQLLTGAAAAPLVTLRRGRPYAPCAAGTDLSMPSTQPCEPGAIAWTTAAAATDGASNLTAASNLTDRVVVCPPLACLRALAAASSSNTTFAALSANATGCSADLLRRHTLAAKGLAGCGINTLAPPGAVFYVDFWVWDDGRPPRNATARRTIVITEPCPEPAAPNFCSDGAGGFLCSPAPCGDATAVFLPPRTDGPTISLLPSGGSSGSDGAAAGGGGGGGSIVYVEFGTVAPVYLGPCALGNDTRGCGATASGFELPTAPGGAVTEADLTPYLSVLATTPCPAAAAAAAPGAQPCLACSLEALAVAGACLPGVYTFRYSVSDEQGRTATADRTVVVYQRARVDATMALLPGGLTDPIASAQLLSNLRNTSHTDYAAALANVTARLTRAGLGVRVSDVDLTAASMAPASPPPSAAAPASLVVGVSVTLYNPPALHRGPQGVAELAAAAGGASGTLAGRRRRGLLGLLADGDAMGDDDEAEDVRAAGVEEDMSAVMAEVWRGLALQRLRELRTQSRPLRALLSLSTSSTSASSSASSAPTQKQWQQQQQDEGRRLLRLELSEVAAGIAGPDLSVQAAAGLPSAGGDYEEADLSELQQQQDEEAAGRDASQQLLARASRMLLQANSTTNATTITTGSNSSDITTANLLSAMAAAVSLSLNATAANASVPPSPDLLTGYAVAAASLASALAASLTDVSTQLAALPSAINTTFGDAAAAFEEELAARAQAALAALLGSSAAAANASLVGAAEVERLLDLQLAAAEAADAAIGELGATMTQLAADTRAQTDRALYVAAAVAAQLALAEEGDASDELALMGAGCYRLQQDGFRVAFTVSRFGGASSSGSSSSGGSARRLLSTGGSSATTVAVSSSGASSSSSSNSNSIISWLGYYLTGGSAAAANSALLARLYSAGNLDFGASLSAAGARPRHLGSGADNRVVGGLLLHTTRRVLPVPVEGDGAAAVAAAGGASGRCGGGSGRSSEFAELDATCHLYELAYLRQNGSSSNSNSTAASSSSSSSTAASSFTGLDSGALAALRRLFGAANNSVAPYGVDPVFLRASPLYRQDLAAKQDWYYNTSDPDQTSPTGAPYGFHARDLAGRPPGFPVLLESGLGAGRAAALLRYLADGNYLDRRQTQALTAELLVYNPGLHAFAFYRANFDWTASGSIAGRVSAVGFPAMPYVTPGGTLAEAMPAIFANELLPLWLLTSFFIVVTVVGVVSAAMRARRHATAAAAAAEEELIAEAEALGLPRPAAGDFHGLHQMSGTAKGGGGGGGGGGARALKPSMTTVRRVLVKGGTGGMTMKMSPAQRMQRDEEAAAREERLEASGVAGLSLRRAIFREFVRHDGGLLYDVAVCLLLVAAAAYWTGVVDNNLALYDAQSYYNIYDAQGFAAANWLLPARAANATLQPAPLAAPSPSSSSSTNGSTSDATDTTATAALSSNAALLLTQLGLTAPNSAGDPGRWMLPAAAPASAGGSDEWDSFNTAISNAHQLVTLWTGYGIIQAVVIIFLIAKLIGVLEFQARLGIICRSLMTMANPIGHLVVVLCVVVVMLAAASNLVMGTRVPAFSTLPGALTDTFGLIVGVGMLDLSYLSDPSLQLSGVERSVAGLILAAQVLLLMFVLVSFFFATMGHIFMKQKHSIDWQGAPGVGSDLVNVVFPDLARKLADLLPGAQERRRRRAAAAALAAAAARAKRAAARPVSDIGAAAAAASISAESEDAEAAAAAAAAAAGCCAPTVACDDLAAPPNRALLRTLAAGGIDELMCAADLPKTWNGRVRAARVEGGRRLIDKATMRGLLLQAASASNKYRLPPGKVVSEDGAGAGADNGQQPADPADLLNVEQRGQALLAARRVMERVGRTYGSQTPEFQALERAAAEEAARRRRDERLLDGAGALMRGAAGADDDEEGAGTPGGAAAAAAAASSPRAPLHHSLSTEIAIHLSIYDALNAAVDSIVRWQSGVHRWQLRTWKQMAAAYLFNQQLMAGLGVAPGPAFVERPPALQDEGGALAAAGPRAGNMVGGGGGGGGADAAGGAAAFAAAGAGGDANCSVLPPWLRVNSPAAAGPPKRASFAEHAASGVLSPSQLSMTEAARARSHSVTAGAGAASHLHPSPHPHAAHHGGNAVAPAFMPAGGGPHATTVAVAPAAPGQGTSATQEGGRWASSSPAPQPHPYPYPPPLPLGAGYAMSPPGSAGTGAGTARHMPLLLEENSQSSWGATSPSTAAPPQPEEQLGEAEIAAVMAAWSTPLEAPLAAPWRPLSTVAYSQTAAAAAAAAAVVVAAKDQPPPPPPMTWAAPAPGRTSQTGVAPTGADGAVVGMTPPPRRPSTTGAVGRTSGSGTGDADRTSGGASGPRTSGGGRTTPLFTGSATMPAIRGGAAVAAGAGVGGNASGWHRERQSPLRDSQSADVQAVLAAAARRMPAPPPVGPPGGARGSSYSHAITPVPEERIGYGAGAADGGTGSPGDTAEVARLRTASEYVPRSGGTSSASASAGAFAGMKERLVGLMKGRSQLGGRDGSSGGGADTGSGGNSPSAVTRRQGSAASAGGAAAGRVSGGGGGGADRNMVYNMAYSMRRRSAEGPEASASEAEGGPQ
ncbi:hypothetical protein HYH02_011496 [Chlamydomonas schloesseri]|uniref:Polycystin cation channel PKD1/PKD2 domain-containing protein n=1 Tax=Chlamydomonas schloesseri TaxID=2026947 RepID=A0A835W4A4_9CHLO|nr:hypothetical protein HYH02_011496 [Chlamydomonas schloesseri]|eukprot:KAG2436559.1 hypothetical protein HYH02_011496 [Chlamydomonas schloesseri]